MCHSLYFFCACCLADITHEELDAHERINFCPQDHLLSSSVPACPLFKDIRIFDNDGTFSSCCWCTLTSNFGSVICQKPYPRKALLIKQAISRK